jgi:small ligand-binding sensory domain FIST
VRHILGAEAESGALLVQGAFEENQVVQFHVRDADTSTDDLRRHVATVPAGAVGRARLLVRRSGRGAVRHAPDFDTQTIAALHRACPSAASSATARSAR